MFIYSRQAWLMLFALALIWGSSFLMIEMGLKALTPMQIALLRIGLGGLALAPLWLKFWQRNRPHPWLWLAMVALIGNLIPALCFAIAQQVVDSAIAGMLNSLQPLFTLIVSIFAFKQSIPRQQIVGVLVGFCGAVILIGVGEGAADYQQNVLYSLLIVVATFCYGTATNLIRHKLTEQNPIKISVFSLGMFSLPCLLAVVFTPIEASFAKEQFWLAFTNIAVLGILGTGVALMLFNRLILGAGVVFASSVTYLIPIVAMAWGWWLGENIRLGHLLGIVIIFIGLYLINRHRRTQPANSSAPSR